MTRMHRGGILRPLAYCKTRTGNTAAEIGSHHLNALQDANFRSPRTQTRQRRYRSNGADLDQGTKTDFCLIAICKIGHSKREGYE